MSRRIFWLLFGVCVVISLGAASAMSQPYRMTAEERTDTLAARLSLTAEQKAKVLTIFKERENKMRAVFEANQGDRDAMRSSMDSLRTVTDTKLKAVLTKGQFELYQEMSPMGGGRGRRSGQQ